MKAKFCDLCGKETHTRSRVLRYTEEFLRVNSDTHTYDVCDECSRKIDEAKNEAEFNTVKSIRDEYLAGKDVVVPDDSDNPGEDGKGMDGMTPDLSKYGSSDFVVDVLNRGKSGFIGVMPNFANSGVLNATQQKAVGAYINSLKGE